MKSADMQTWLGLIQLHLSWYPLMELADVYKLLYQGMMGPEHMVATQQEFTRRLNGEFESLQASLGQPVLEIIRPDHTLYRLNLRPLKSLYSTIDPLVKSLLATTREVAGSLDELKLLWVDFAHWCQQGGLPQFSGEQVDEFSGWLLEQGYPTLHHSEMYSRMYQPAYRLISSKFTTELGLADAG